MQTDNEYAKRMPQRQITHVLTAWNLPAVETVQPGSGTASPKLLLRTREGRFLLRRRRHEFSDPDTVRFDHAVLRRLHRHGIPVACPLVSRSGDSFVRCEGWAFEIVPVIENLRPFDPDSRAQLRAAAHVLARIHTATEAFEPEGRKDWEREFHAARNAATLSEHLRDWRDGAADPGRLALAERMLAQLQQAAAELPDARVAALPHCIVHGDYTTANVLFRADAVGGVFDFDWTYRQARLDDVGRAILFFAFRRPHPIDEGSIWSLVQPWQGDLERARCFLDAYTRRLALTPDERAFLPWFIAETALSMRVRAMRKVPDERRLEMLTFGMAPVLDWLLTHTGPL